MDSHTEKNVFVDKYLTPVALIVAAIIIAGAFIFGRPGASAPTPVDTAAGTAIDSTTLATDGEPFIGDKNAPTTIAIYYDYQCPFCKQFEQNVTPKLIDAYVKTGKAKIVFKDFQFLGKDSDTAALFGRAVWDVAPDHFYDWYMAMFNAQDEEGDKGFGNLATIEKLTAGIPGIDLAQVEKVMTAKKDSFEKLIARDRAEGAALGINGTPSIVAGTKVFTGLSPEQFYAKITQELDLRLKK